MEKYLPNSDPSEDLNGEVIQFDLESQHESDSNTTLSAHIPTATPNFQSSFARSLSFNTNQSQSLDAFELNFRIGAEAADRQLSSVLQGFHSDHRDENTFAFTSLHNHQTTQHPPPPASPPPPLPSSPPPTIHNVSVELSGGTAVHQPDQPEQSAINVPATPTKARGGRMYLPSSTPKRRYMTISSIKAHTVSFSFEFCYHFQYHKNIVSFILIKYIVFLLYFMENTIV